MSLRGLSFEESGMRIRAASDPFAYPTGSQSRPIA